MNNHARGHRLENSGDFFSPMEWMFVGISHQIVIFANSRSLQSSPNICFVPTKYSNLLNHKILSHLNIKSVNSVLLKLGVQANLSTATCCPFYS